MGQKVDRFWEVDAARGVAIIMMIVYHSTYDLDTLGGYDIQSTTGLWALFADVTASLFLFLVGISLAISRARTSLTGWRLFGKYLARGLRILAYGVVLTVIFLALGMGVVAFGILHLIGISIILAYPFLKLRFTNLVLGTLIFVAGQYILARGLDSQSIWLLPFGIVPEGVIMPDYRPLLPWFGVVLIGLFFGNVVYGDGRRPARTEDEAPVPARPLLPLGRNSLFIYLIHQPILVAMLAASGLVDLNFL
ncbi:MAG TPA: heparan-alpha-glucosaminide N-acetyltransferase [Rubrobacter sp.]|nr:heparan-alpha-glucosaminide N-acetyltransferase [Rubrobacter sp.]